MQVSSFNLGIYFKECCSTTSYDHAEYVLLPFFKKIVDRKIIVGTYLKKDGIGMFALL